MDFATWPWKEIVVGAVALIVAILNKTASSKAGDAAAAAKELGDVLKATTAQMARGSEAQSENLRAALETVNKLIDRIPKQTG